MIYEAIKQILDTGKDVAVNILGYVDIIIDPEWTKDYVYLWNKGQTQAFRYRNGSRVYLIPKQVERYKEV